MELTASAGPVVEPRRRGRPRAEIRRRPILGLRGRAEFRDWLADLARERGLGLSDLLEESLRFYAAGAGFRPPPER
jgi:hypothetical protein